MVTAGRRNSRDLVRGSAGPEAHAETARRLPANSGRAKPLILRIVSLTARALGPPQLFSEVDTVIAHLQRTGNTAGLLAYLYGPGERGEHVDPRLIAGDGHGAPMELLAESGSLSYLALALDAPVERLGGRAPERPVWVCSVRSDPRLPDLTDAQWATVSRRVVAAAGVAPVGDPDACRWIAVRNQPRQVHVVATIVREDGSLHSTYRDAARVQTECHRIGAELGHLPPRPVQEAPMPVPPITITAELSGSVLAKNARDDLSAALLRHAGFQQIEDWHGRRHRLPTTTPAADRIAIASHAAEMLRAARYDVDLAPSLDNTRTNDPTLVNPLGPYVAGAEILRITDRIRGAENGTDLRQAVDHLLHPEHGALERVREALEATGEQITDLDDEEHQLADRFGFAAEFVLSAQSELVHSEAELPRVREAYGVAQAVSPAVAKAKTRASSPLGTGAPETGAAVTAQAPGPRTR